MMERQTVSNDQAPQLEDAVRSMIQNNVPSVPTGNQRAARGQRNQRGNSQRQNRGRDYSNRGSGRGRSSGSQHHHLPPNQRLPNRDAQQYRDQQPRVVQRGRPHTFHNQIDSRSSHLSNPYNPQDLITFHGAARPYTPIRRPPRPPPISPDQFNRQCTHLEQIATRELQHIQISDDELKSKDLFRSHLEQICVEVVKAEKSDDTLPPALLSFGSISSGFAMPGSDMDLALVSSAASEKLFRLIEKRLLDLGHGAHLLTRTRVPILKVCESPNSNLLFALREERRKWDNMTIEEREEYDHPLPRETQKKSKKVNEQDDSTVNTTNKSHGKQDSPHDEEKKVDSRSLDVSSLTISEKDVDINAKASKTNTLAKSPPEESSNPDTNVNNPLDSSPRLAISQSGHSDQQSNRKATASQKRDKRHWHREKPLGPLDFPKDGVGTQCDINFANPLGLHNTTLLRCYSCCDSRVRLMVLFIKSWASRRKINSPRNGTLSSYGYVLMVLHFLVNIAKPFVCPNLQLAVKEKIPLSSQDENTVCEGWDVRFWRNESELLSLARKDMLNHNRDTLGCLLRNFFNYYAAIGHTVPSGGFRWTQEVLSLRTPDGILEKQQKGWTGATTVVHDGNEVRNQYLFAIEDPFELSHNVARTVTHNGICAIRDEFRRAWRILGDIARAGWTDDELLEEVHDVKPPPAPEVQGDTSLAAGADGEQEDYEKKQLVVDTLQNAVDRGALEGDASRAIVPQVSMVEEQRSGGPGVDIIAPPAV